MPMAEFKEFLEAVPDTTRRDIAKILKQHDLTTYDGYICFTQDVMISVLVGDIPPAVAQEARRWAELTFTALAVATDKYNVSPQETQNNILAILQGGLSSLPDLGQLDFDTIDAAERLKITGR